MKNVPTPIRNQDVFWLREIDGEKQNVNLKHIVYCQITNTYTWIISFVHNKVY